MDLKKEENPKDFLSTRETAKHLQVSLGTVQKMVETGELLAWKTRGGHRRILMSSLEQLLTRRRMGIRERCGNQFLLLCILRGEEQFEDFKKFVEPWESSVDLHLCHDTLEALMQAVSLSPDVIYLDWQISPVEQVHLLHYLQRNLHTRHIPTLVEAGFLKLHPQVTKIPPEIKEYPPNKEPKILTNAMIRGYKKDKLLLAKGELNLLYAHKIETLILDCLVQKCEEAGI